MGPIARVNAVPPVADNSPLAASLADLAADQSALTVTQLVNHTDVVGAAALSIPPTPAALLEISPAACGLVNPIVTLIDNTQLLLLGAQTLQIIGAGARHLPPRASPSPAPAIPRPLPPAPASPSQATAPTRALPPPSALPAQAAANKVLPPAPASTSPATAAARAVLPIGQAVDTSA